MTVHARKVIGGMGWVALSHYANRLLGFVSTLILAKLLVPEDFGLVALAAMVVDVMKLFRDVGMGQALIHRREDVEKASHTAFYLLIGLNSLLYLAAVAVSPFIADYYNNPAVTMVLIITSSSLVWYSIRAVPEALVRKEVDFRKLVIPEVVPGVIATIVSIWMAYNGFGVWSLVVKSLIADIMASVLIWRYTVFRPKLRYDWAIAKEMLHYGKYLLGSSIVMVVVYNIDRFYISKYEGLSALGLYVLAFTIAGMPTTEVGHIVCRVMFPVFSKLNHDMERLRDVFLRTVRYSGLLVIPLSIGVAVYAEVFVRIVFGEKWAGMTFALQMLCIHALTRSLSTVIHELYKATGQTRLVQRFSIGRLAMIGVLGIPAVVSFGMDGIAILLALTYSAIFFMEAYFACQFVGISTGRFLQQFAMPTIYSILTIGIVYFAIGSITPILSISTLILAVAVTIGSYFLVVGYLDKKTMTEFRQLFTAMRSPG